MSDWITSFPSADNQESTFRNLKEMLSDHSEKYQDFTGDFKKFMDQVTTTCETKMFWSKFVFQDGFAYVSLYLAIHNGKWYLRMGAIKTMAALFTAFDRSNYQKLIPDHIVDMLKISNEVLSHLESRGFAIGILGRHWCR